MAGLCQHPAQNRCPAALTPPEDIRILPVTADSAAEWAARYNERFRAVPTAETCMPADYPILEREACFLADRAGLVGIGRIRADTLLAVATLRPGWGERLVRPWRSGAKRPGSRSCAQKKTAGRWSSTSGWALTWGRCSASGTGWNEPRPERSRPPRVGRISPCAPPVFPL